MKSVQRVVLAIPARNEETLLAECLKEVQRAVDALLLVRPDIKVATVVGLDGCTDRSGWTSVARRPRRLPCRSWRRSSRSATT